MNPGLKNFIIFIACKITWFLIGFTLYVKYRNKNFKIKNLFKESIELPIWELPRVYLFLFVWPLASLYYFVIKK